MEREQGDEATKRPFEGAQGRRSDDGEDVVMLLTPPGAAAIGVVRLSGPRVFEFLKDHVTPAISPLRAIHAKLRDGDQVLDDPVVVMNDGARWVDLNLHGGPWVVRSVLDLAQREGFKLAADATGPLPGSAVDGESAIEREMLQYLPLARTELALKVLLAQPNAWRRLEERQLSADEIRAILEDRSLEWLLSLPRVAIIGAPNVGKSTLANALFAQQRSITADMPGTTRDWVGEIANIDGLAVMLLDTPGVRDTDDAIERIARQVQCADLIILVLDATRALDPEQSPLLARYPQALLVINKSDQPTVCNVERKAVKTVATTCKGIDSLRHAMLQHFGCLNLQLDQPRCWTNRQREILKLNHHAG